MIPSDLVLTFYLIARGMEISMEILFLPLWNDRSASSLRRIHFAARRSRNEVDVMDLFFFFFRSRQQHKPRAIDPPQVCDLGDTISDVIALKAKPGTLKNHLGKNLESTIGLPVRRLMVPISVTT